MKKLVLQPPAVIGIIGGGQLGKMMTVEAKRLGYRVVVLDPTPAAPAAQVADKQIIGSFSDRAFLRQLAQESDVLTYEFEHIQAAFLSELEAECVKIYPSGKTLQKIQNKGEQKAMLLKAGLPVPSFRRVTGKEDVENAAAVMGLPLVLKTCAGGYDGKGNYVIRHQGEIAQAMEAFAGAEVMVEQFIDFACELSVIGARDLHDNMVFYPVAENIHESSILRTTRVPAPLPAEIAEKAVEVARKTLEFLDDYGVFCIEMFLTRQGEIYINEIAPRPHNSGHYTVEACSTSQFEQLVRVVTGMPLGSSQLICPAVMVNILGNDQVKGKYSFQGTDKVLAEEGVYLHLYGKHETQWLKKIGHITALASSVEKGEEKACRALNHLVIIPEGEGDFYDGTK